ncbi:phosphoribosyltransferase [Xanthobacter aminoxidans]|uniref:phosphoribosyltransferase n=1 Tax=Xanthobacter aminoxidans TaxID=186280 RepID=UPI00372AADE4
MGGTCEITLSTEKVVQLVYGAQHPGSGTVYLQSVRMRKVDEQSGVALCYRSLLSNNAGRLAALVRDQVPEIDAVVSPPSSRQDAVPYREAILRDRPGTPDLSGDFTRAGKTKAGDSKTTVKDMVDEFQYRSVKDLSGVKSLLIVDESISTGKTVAAVLQHLYANGLPEDCRITVAVWAKLSPRTKATPAEGAKG